MKCFAELITTQKTVAEEIKKIHTKNYFFCKNYRFWCFFLIFSATVLSKYLWVFLRCVQCPKTLLLSYQNQQSKNYSMYSLGRRLKVPQGFSKGEPEATSKARQKAKNTRGRRPQGFLSFGLAEDVTKVLPLENPEGGLQYSYEGVH